jgi:hypothetical protein
MWRFKVLNFTKVSFLLMIILLSIAGCRGYRIVVDDSSRDVVSFKIDQDKRQSAFKLIDEFEQKVDDSTYHQQSVLKNVGMHDVFEDLRTMLDYPNSTILGNSGHYCSVATVINWLLNNQPDKYTKAVLDLTYYGKTNFEGGIIKVPGKLCKKVDYNIIDTVDFKIIRKDIEATSISDFVLGVSLMYAEKGLQRIGMINRHALFNKKRPGAFVFAITGPWELDDLFERVDVKFEKQGFYLSDKENIETLKAIEKAVNNGKMPVIFDNHIISFGQRQNALYGYTGTHYITIHYMKVDWENDVVDYCYWDYGRVKNNPFKTRTIKAKPVNTISGTVRKVEHFKKKNVVQKRTITTKEFLKAMKGYWIPEQ